MTTDAPAEARAAPPQARTDDAVEPNEAVACPFCNSLDTREIAAFGCQHLVSQYQCGTCRTYFEAIRDDR